MDGNPEQQLTETIQNCLETARNLKEEYASLLQKKKSTYTASDSGNSVKQTTLATNDLNKQLKDNKLALHSNRQQLKLALEQYLNTQSDLSTSEESSDSEDSSAIQSDANQRQIAQVTINQQVKPSDNDNNGQNEAKLNPTAQALFTGTLPDDFFLHLLSVMGIQDCLLSNRLVCSLWNELVLERCHNQKSLKLFETFDNLMEYGEDLLGYEKTDDPRIRKISIGDDLLIEERETDRKQRVVKQLVNRLIGKEIEGEYDTEDILTTLFPKVEELVLCTEHPTFINIEHLLQFYAEQLTSLTMKFSALHERPSSKLRAFTFPKLKSLNTFSFSPEKEQLLSLLPQLESLTLSHSAISLETFLRTGTQLGELKIGYLQSVYTAPEGEFSKRPRINTNLRKFSFATLENELPVLEFISLNLTSLECLKLFWRCYPQNLHLLTSHLAPLRQLHSLTFQAQVSFFLLDDAQLTEIQPLPSVRHLKLLLWDYAYLPLEFMDLFSRVLFTAFPNAEQVLIGFVGNYGLDNAATFAAFEDLAGKHPNVVQLFRSRDMSKCTALPNAVSPLLGPHRQVYEEYIEEEELFGVAICKLTEYLVTPEGEEGPNLKITLRAADRLTALSNLLQLLESKAFDFTVEMVKAMIEHMVNCALNYGPSQGALFIVTCKVVLSLLDYRIVDALKRETPFMYALGEEVYPLKMMLKLVEHFQIQKQLDNKKLLLQLYKRMVEHLKELDLLRG